MIRIAIIGAGSMAGEHAKHYGRLEGVEVVAVCDRDFPKAQAFAERHGIADVYQSLDDMLARDDIHASYCQIWCMSIRRRLCRIDHPPVLHPETERYSRPASVG